MNNTTITIPKELAKKGNLVLIPQKEYEEFLECQFEQLKKKKGGINLTELQKKRLKKARENLKQGKSLTIYELKRKLGVKN